MRRTRRRSCRRRSRTRRAGSDRTLPFFKYFGQYFHYFPLQAPQRKPFTNEILRPRLVFATGVRVGLAQGIGGDVPLERAVLRRRQHDAARLRAERGRARSAGSRPARRRGAARPQQRAARAAVRIVRRRASSPTSATSSRVCRDFSFTDLRESAGVGLRVRTPWFLLRGDYGLVLDRASGERRSRFYFSIGQAF